MDRPIKPASASVTGVSHSTLFSLLLKALHGGRAENLPELVQLLKLPSHIISGLVDEAIALDLLKVTGAAGDSALPILTYSLTIAGRTAAAEALERNGYIGPAPVGLQAYRNRVKALALRNERLDPARMSGAFSDLVLAENFINRIGPAITAGRSILLYGPPGNGKSSVARSVGRMFTNVIYVPYCIEIEGQIIKIFDPGVHQEATAPEGGRHPNSDIHEEDIDYRWVACRRPVIITGGEFSLDMLDLHYIETSKVYEAPLHIKAMGGVFIIDDFGRQLAQPKDILNRWMIPLDERVDYLKILSGTTISLPFETLVIFCTNLAPNTLMDAAFLRRIPYKIKLRPPSVEQYREIFERAAAEKGLKLSRSAFDWLISELRDHRKLPLGCYQPRFIVDHHIEACAFEGRPAVLEKPLVAAALDDLYAEDS